MFLKIVYKKWEQNHREFGDDIRFKTDQTKKCRTQKDEKLDFYKNKEETYLLKTYIKTYIKPYWTK